MWMVLMPIFLILLLRNCDGLLSKSISIYTRERYSSHNMKNSLFKFQAISSPTIALTTTNTVWNDIIDDAYLITTNQSKENKRLEQTKSELEKVLLWDKVNVRTFKTDDEDRVRGCYTSHIAVLKEIQNKYQLKDNYQVLILEDNLELTAQGESNFDEITTNLREFLNLQKFDQNIPNWDVFHLAYMMYVPGLSMQIMNRDDKYKNEKWANNVVKMYATIGASVGTSAYIVSKSGVENLLKFHDQYGYREAIPNVMAEIFPESRYASYPMIFHRAGKIGSLVNPQLDDFRKVMFNPIMYTLWERLMVGTGLQNNQIFPTLLGSLFILLLSLVVNIVLGVVYPTGQGNEYSSNINTITSIAPLLPLLVVPLGIGLWGASLFKAGGTGAGFTASANAAAAARKTFNKSQSD